MKIVSRVLIASILFANLWTARGALAAEGCTVNGMVGKATVEREGQTSSVQMADLLKKGDKIETSADGTLDMSMNDLAGCRLLGGTCVHVAGWKPENMSLVVEQGNVILNLSKLPQKSSFKVETPTAVATVRGTQFWGRVNPDAGGLTTIAVRRGRVEIFDKASAGTFVLDAGQALDLGGKTPAAVRPAADAEMKAMEQADSVPMVATAS